MNSRWRLAAAGFALALGACGGDGTGPDADPDPDPDPDAIPTSLLGIWRAGPACFPGCALILYDRATPADSVNFAALITWQLTIVASGDLEMRASGPAQEALLAGTLVVESGQLIVQGEEASDTLDYSLVQGVLRATLRSSLTFDLDGDGEDQPVGLRLRMQR
jgi:hypothetical protein